ncbi:MAG: stage V sporulation T C-terminal domain-containing protein [Firmicutes bacterium]|nr:stage V sporulation T C-terminal domain-containing protein [Bacillota bacterium]
MKATGIVRRIDDLGRVVIPKEIRRTLRIREGDPLEIFTDSDGGVIFKKYSPVGEMSPMAAQYTDVLSKTAGLPCLVCDRDHVIAAAGVSRKEYLERRISPALEEMIENRRSYFIKKGEKPTLLPVEGLERNAAAVAPILAGGDVFGAVVLMSGDSGALPGETEQKLVVTAAAFLSRLMEEE